MALFIMRLVVCWALLALPTAARAQRAGPDGIVVLATQTLTGGGSLRIAIPDSDVRAYAVRIAVVEGTLDVQRVIISYANGQTHFEDRPVKLGAGRSLSPIDERAEARQIESVELVLAPGARLTTPVKVEVSAITRMPVDAHAKPKPPAREPVADASTASPPASRPRTTRGFSSGPAADDKPYTAVPVFFGTDRRKEADRSKWNRQLASFSGSGASALTYGRAVISVPKAGRERGEIRRPEWDLFFTTVSLRKENLATDFTLLDVAVVDKASFVAEARKHRANSKTFKDQAFVFVHGYRVSFDDALFRAAQIAHDMDFDGIPFMYSWPSSAGVLGYLYDEKAAIGARDHLRSFLDTVVKDSGATKVHLIAHSMGSLALLEVLRDIANAGGQQVAKPLFNEVIIAAPDVTRDTFIQIVDKIRGLATGITLYASANDRALRLSQRLSGTSAGTVPTNGPVIAKGVDSIDVSEASTDFFSLNHSAFADRSPLLDDMKTLIGQGAHPPDKRAIFSPITGGGGLYWKFIKKPAP